MVPVVALFLGKSAAGRGFRGQMKKSESTYNSRASPPVFRAAWCTLATLEIPHMTVEDQIERYIESQLEPKRSDLHALHRIIRQAAPSCRLWFLDGTDDNGKTVTNPNVGYGVQTIRYADGKSREFYRVGLSANKAGISVYILGLNDKEYLAQKYAKAIGKASVSGYCIKFKTLRAISLHVLETAIRDGLTTSSTHNSPTIA